MVPQYKCNRALVSREHSVKQINQTRVLIHFKLNQKTTLPLSTIQHFSPSFHEVPPLFTCQSFSKKGYATKIRMTCTYVRTNYYSNNDQYYIKLTQTINGVLENHLLLHYPPF